MVFEPSAVATVAGLMPTTERERSSPFAAKVWRA